MRVGPLSVLLLAGPLVLSGCVTEVSGHGVAAPEVASESTPEDQSPAEDSTTNADEICNRLSFGTLSPLAGRRLTRCSPSGNASDIYDEDGYDVLQVSAVDYDVDFAESEMRAAAPGKQRIPGFGDEPALWDSRSLVFEARYEGSLLEIEVHVPMNPARALHVCEESIHELGG